MLWCGRPQMIGESVRGTAGRDISMEWTFGTLLWSMLILFFWFAVIWMFIGIFADILRRDMSGWAKAGWIFLIVLLPFLGMLLYLIARPPTVEAEDRFILARRPPGNGTRATGAADEIAKAAQLHDQGKITADEFERLKQHALTY
jgi:hypothetical protein